MNSEAETILFDIVRAYVLVQRVGDAIVPPFGVETYEFHMLFRMRDEPPMTQAELGRRTLRDPMSVSRIVRSLEERGFVKRTPSAADTRANLVSLTPKGATLITDALKGLGGSDAFRGWTKQDLRAFSQLLHRAIDSLQDAVIRHGIDPKRGPDGTKRVDRSQSKEPLSRAAKRRQR